MNKGLKIAVQLMFLAIVAVLIQVLFHPLHFDAEQTPLPELTRPLVPEQSEPYSDAAATPSEQVEKSVEQLNIELRKEIVRKRKEADALEARKRQAFAEWWDMPRWCLDEDTMKVLVQCSDLKRTKRAEFDQLLAEGKISLPPEPRPANSSPAQPSTK